MACLGHLRRGLLRAKGFGVVEDVAQVSQALRRQQIVERQGQRALDAVGEVAVDRDRLDVADDQQRRVLQRFPVLQQLAVGLLHAAARPFVLDGEVAAIPDIGPALAAALLGRAGLEGEELVLGVKRRWRLMLHQRAQIEKVLLRDLTFGGCVAAPLGDEFLWGHGLRFHFSAIN